MKEIKNNAKEKMTREEYLYHNTELLLKKYREVVLSIEASLIHTKLNFQLEIILRRRHADGEMYYWILYYTYLSEKPCKTVENIMDKVSEKTEFMS